jgi:hypothetical protein
MVAGFPSFAVEVEVLEEKALQLAPVDQGGVPILAKAGKIFY